MDTPSSISSSYYLFLCKSLSTTIILPFYYYSHSLTPTQTTLPLSLPPPPPPSPSPSLSLSLSLPSLPPAGLFVSFSHPTPSSSFTTQGWQTMCYMHMKLQFYQEYIHCKRGKRVLYSVFLNIYMQPCIRYDDMCVCVSVSGRACTVWMLCTLVWVEVQKKQNSRRQDWTSSKQSHVAL